MFKTKNTEEIGECDEGILFFSVCIGAAVACFFRNTAPEPEPTD
ncbi:MAG: hypothetical protein WC831_00530 [Parcubacteria group bacterium]